MKPTHEIISAETGKKVSATTTVNALIESLLETYDRHRIGVIDNATALTSARLGGVVLQGIRTQIYYDNSVGRKSDIPFMKNMKLIKPKKEENK